MKNYDSDTMACFADGNRLSTDNGYVHTNELEDKWHAMECVIVKDLIHYVDEFESPDYHLEVVWSQEYKYPFIAILIPDKEFDMVGEFDVLYGQLDKHLDDNGVIFE